MRNPWEEPHQLPCRHWFHRPNSLKKSNFVEEWGVILDSSWGEKPLEAYVDAGHCFAQPCSYCPHHCPHLRYRIRQCISRSQPGPSLVAAEAKHIASPVACSPKYSPSWVCAAKVACIAGMKRPHRSIHYSSLTWSMPRGPYSYGQWFSWSVAKLISGVNSAEVMIKVLQ